MKQILMVGTSSSRYGMEWVGVLLIAVTAIGATKILRNGTPTRMDNGTLITLEFGQDVAIKIAVDKP